MEGPVLRKPRLYFDTAAHPAHVTFDDGQDQRYNLPWLHYVETRWDHGAADTLRVTVGDWLVVIVGHNLAPLFQAIEEHSLMRLRAQPDLAQGQDHLGDTYATEIRFRLAPGRRSRQKGLTAGGLATGPESGIL